MPSPPPTCFNQILRFPCPPRSDAYATSFPSGDSAGSVVRPESAVTLVRTDRSQSGQLRVTMKRAAARRHLVQDPAERENIAARVHLSAFGLLRGHVGYRADNRTFFGLGQAHAQSGSQLIGVGGLHQF